MRLTRRDGSVLSCVFVSGLTTSTDDNCVRDFWLFRRFGVNVFFVLWVEFRSAPGFSARTVTKVEGTARRNSNAINKISRKLVNKS